jgi:hypothetical protein
MIPNGITREALRLFFTEYLIIATEFSGDLFELRILFLVLGASFWVYGGVTATSDKTLRPKM